MFESAVDFNQPLDMWNLGSVVNISGMFCNAKSFNQRLDDWDVGHISYFSCMVHGVDEAYKMWKTARNWNVDVMVVMPDLPFWCRLYWEARAQCKNLIKG